MLWLDAQKTSVRPQFANRYKLPFANRANNIGSDYETVGANGGMMIVSVSGTVVSV